MFKKSLFFSALLLCSLSSYSTAEETIEIQTLTAEQTAPNIQTADSSAEMTAKRALEKLQAGNLRFMNDEPRDWSYDHIRNVTSTHGQHPLAFVFSCVDSRSSADIVFDQGIGNIFSGRIAGNVIGTDVLGSMEYAIQYAGSKLVVIMGHTQCGAVGAACTGKSYGNNLNHLLLKMDSAVSRVDKEYGGLNCSDETQVDDIAKQNVLNQMRIARFKSTSLNDMTESGEVMLVGAMHDLVTGKVTFFDIDGKAL